MTYTYYLFARWGACNDGDCDSVWEEFTDYAEALARVRELVRDNYGVTWKLIHGEQVAQHLLDSETP